jgi:hypothetical protein
MCSALRDLPISMKVHRDLPDSVALARRSAAFREIRYLPNVENPITLMQ